MEKTTFLRVLRIASALFINLATGYLGVSIFATVFVPGSVHDTGLFIRNIVFGAFCLYHAYLCEQILDES